MWHLLFDCNVSCLFHNHREILWRLYLISILKTSRDIISVNTFRISWETHLLSLQISHDCNSGISLAYRFSNWIKLNCASGFIQIANPWHWRQNNVANKAILADIEGTMLAAATWKAILHKSYHLTNLDHVLIIEAGVLIFIAVAQISEDTFFHGVY